MYYIAKLRTDKLIIVIILKDEVMFVVTGAAGFIGSVVVEELNRVFPDTPVTVIDWMGEDQRWKNLNKRTLADIVFPEDTMDYLDEHENEIIAVINMGAISATTATDVDALVEQNCAYTLDLFRWCADANKQFIYASSASTYGDGRQGFDDNEGLEYLSKLIPMNAYGFTKHMEDKAIVTSKKHPPQWVGLKFFNVYGPNEYHKGGMQSVISHAFRQIKDTGKVKLFKSHNENYIDGGQMRDFVYVKDIVRAITWFVQHKEVSGIFNMGTGNARTFKDLATSVFTALELEPNIEYIDMPEHIREHYQYHTEANMEKFYEVYEEIEKKCFEFSTLEDGTKDYVQNYLNKMDPHL